MGKHSVFAGGVLLLVGILAFQLMRTDAVPGASPTQTVSPVHTMQNEQDLPAARNYAKPF